MGFVFDRRHDFHEPLHIVGGHAAADRLFETGEMPVHASGDLQALRRRRDHERAAILRADLARDEATSREPVEDARQGRALVRKATMELGDRCRRRGRQQREDMPFALRQAVVTQIRQVEADPVCGSMNGWDQTE